MSEVLVKIASVLPPYKGKQEIVKKRQDTEDIIHEILENHKRNAASYDRLVAVHNFWKGDIESTCKEIFEFCKKNLPYKVEPTLSQSVKTPAAILAEARSYGNDCKHYASFIVGICEALKRKGLPMRSMYRFACYKPNDSNPGHVFAVVRGSKGQEIFVDPVLDYLDQRNPKYFFKLDKKPPVMTLVRISGMAYNNYIAGDIGNTDYGWVSGKGGFLKKVVRNPLLNPGAIPIRHAKVMQAVRRFQQQNGRLPNGKEMKAIRRAIGDVTIVPLPGEMGFIGEIGAAKKKAKRTKEEKKAKKAARKANRQTKGKGRLALKVAGATSRNAYLLMLKMNVFHLATNIMKRVNGSQNDPAWKKIADKWKKLGGNPKVLWKNIVQGTKVYNKKKKHKNKVAIKGFDDVQNNYSMSAPFVLEQESTIYGNYDINDLSGIDNDVDVSGIGVIENPDGSLAEVGAVGDFYENYTMAGIGVAPAVGLAAILAAAAPIIAAMKSILSSLGIKSDKSAEAAEAAQEQIVEEHNNAAEDSTKVDENGVVYHDEGVAQTKVTTDPKTGGDNLNLNVASHEDGSSQASTVESGGDTSVAAPKGDGGQGMSDFLATVKNYFGENKKEVMIGSASIMAGLVIPGMLNPRKQKGLATAIKFVGIGAGAYFLLSPLIKKV